MRPRPRAAGESPGSPALVRAGMWVAGLSVASKLLGIGREAFLAWAFGTSPVADALRVAQTGTFLVIHLLAGSALDSAFLPTFKHHLAAGRPRLAWRTTVLAARALAVAGALAFLALVLGARGWARLLAPGFDAERLDLTALLVVAMAVAVPLGLLSNLAGTVSAGLYRFRVPAIRAAVQNLALLGGIAAAFLLGSVVWLGAALPIAQVAMLVLLIVSLRRVPRPRAAGSPARDRAIWRHFGVALVPGVALVCLEQAQLVIEKIVASGLRPGSVAALEYARFLVETPVVTLGVGITQPLLPRLADLSATGDEAGFRRSMRTLLLACVWALLPASVWLAVFAEDVIRVIYARGAFDEASVAATAAALGGFAAGMWAWFGGMVLRQAFYAGRRLAALLPLTALALAGFAGLALLWAPRHGVGGVALAFGVAQILFFAGGLAASGRALLGSILPTLGFLLVGSAGVYGLGRWLAGILTGAHPIVRLAAGALAIGLAWAGWTWLRPGPRAIARDAWERTGQMWRRARKVE